MATPTYLANGTHTQYTILSNFPNANSNTNVLYSINSITVTNGGSNYNYIPQIDIVGGGGTGARAIASAPVNGSLATGNSSIQVVNQGFGYKYSELSNIHVNIRGLGSVGTVIIANSGGGYSNTPTAIFSSPTYPNGAPNPNGITANATLVLAQNSIAQVIIGDTGSGYSTAPSILVTAAQNNYPSYSANLVAMLNEGVGATATANPLPYYTSEPVQGGSYYLRTNATQIFTWDTTAFNGNIIVQATLISNPLETDWFDVKQLDLTKSDRQETITGKFYWVRARVEDFTAGTVNSLTVSYPYNQ